MSFAIPLRQSDHPPLDPERQGRARQHARETRALSLVESALTAAGLLALLVSGVSLSLRETLIAPAPLAAVIYLVALALGREALTAPLHYFRSFVAPRRRGMATPRPLSWLIQRAKRGMIALPLASAVVAFGYWSMSAYPQWWWLLTGTLLLVVTLALNVLAPVLIVPLFFRCRPLSDPDLGRRLTDLARRAGTKVVGAFSIEQEGRGSGIGAMLMGMGKTRRIVLARNIVRAYTPEEIEVILAHELGHHLNRDIPRLMLLRSALGIAGFYLAHLAMMSLEGQLGLAGPGDVAALPLVVLTLGAFYFLTGPFTSAYLRRLEHAADRVALRLTGDARAFVALMTKMANQNLSEAQPSRWAELLFYRHPSYYRRVEMALRYSDSISLTPSLEESQTARETH